MLQSKDIITPVDFRATEETTLKEAITLMHQKKLSIPLNRNSNTFCMQTKIK